MSWRQRKRREEDLERELRSHLDLEAEEQRESGLSSEEASYGARRFFGNATSVKEDTRATWSWASLERIAQDVRYALRTLRRNPAFAIAAILTLTLGIGANSAVSLAVTRLLANRLYEIHATDPETFLVVILLLVAISLLASYLAARRTVRLDPTVALRYE